MRGLLEIKRERAIAGALSGDYNGILRLKQHLLDAKDFDISILNAVLPFLQDAYLPSKFAYLDAQVEQTNTQDRHCSATLRPVERARLSAAVIEALCKECPAGIMQQKIAQKLCSHFSTLVQWADLFCFAGFVEDSARLLLQLWEFNSMTTTTMQHSVPATRIVLTLWTKKDALTGRYVISRGNQCPLILLLFSLAQNVDSQRLVLGFLNYAKKREISAIAYGFQIRMEELGSLCAQRIITTHFAVTHLLALADTLQTLLPCDSRRYWVKFISKAHLLSSLYTSLSIIMPLSQNNIPWTWAAEGLEYVVHFVLDGGVYAGSPISKMVDVVQGDVIERLLGCLIHLRPSDEGLETAMHLLSSIGGYLVYRPVWEAACKYLSKDVPEGGDLLPSAVTDLLKGNSRTGWRAWETFQRAFWGATRCHMGGKAELLTLLGCNNLKHDQHSRSILGHSRQCFQCHSVMYCSRECQREDWKALHREECPTLSLLYRLRELNDWIPISIKVDVLAYVETFCNSHRNAIWDAVSIVNPPIPTGRPFVIVLDIAFYPHTMAIAPVPAHAFPKLRRPRLLNRMNAYMEQFLERPGDQLVELHFKHGRADHLALIRLHRHGRGLSESYTVLNGAFGL